MNQVNVYIDGNNLYRSAKELGFDIDYKKFRGWLRQKYNPVNVYIFIGFMSKKAGLYKYLQNSGYKLPWKLLR